jgi:hypothetical protein
MGAPRCGRPHGVIKLNGQNEFKRSYRTVSRSLFVGIQTVHEVNYD